MSFPGGAVRLQFNSTLGAAFLGQFATAILYGITSLQTFIYYKQHYKDPLILRFLVGVLWILDGIHVAFITHAMYMYMIVNFANPLNVDKPIWSVWAMIIVSNISNIIVRAIFSRTLWKLSGKALIFPLVIGLLSIYVAADAFYFAIRGFRIDSYLDIHHFSWSLYNGFAFEVLVDGMITVSQCLLLRRFRTGIKSTDSIITILMVYSINTGLLTSICAILCLVTFTVLPDMFVYFAFYFVLSKLYVNSVLANLNARSTILENMPGAKPLNKYDYTDPSSMSSGGANLVPAQFSSVVDPVLLTTRGERSVLATIGETSPV
ncbi:hypothetical protein WOLCODRAFT_139462 [Wolfiporia cocos MD-104 SS10]|uniref:DUF6534 domain-containing protein n=1 Tax=Wolfiporia cocos (strain MD-104) TaxID=742152 RepID=A0A2H3J496_WOLCO|nr:hypothetical protein WOLCODRAFT_139462 [Wolfiporia cocos MD-104 SS10]